MRTIAIAACLLAFVDVAMAADNEKAAKVPAASAAKAANVPAANAETKAAKAPAANAETNAAKGPSANAKGTSRMPHATKATKMPPLEKLTCRTGPNDEQVRLIVEAVKGRAMEFAFYSRLGTRVCSIHARRGDSLSKWEDDDAASGKANIKLYTGSAVLEYEPGHVKLKFTNVDRMHYCGMYGELNGAVEVLLKKPECGMQGVFEGSNIQEPKSPAAAGD